MKNISKSKVLFGYDAYWEGYVFFQLGIQTGAVVGEYSFKLDSVIWESCELMVIPGACMMVMVHVMIACVHGCIWWWWTARFQNGGGEEEKDKHAHSQRSGTSALIGSRILMHNK